MVWKLKPAHPRHIHPEFYCKISRRNREVILYKFNRSPQSILLHINLQKNPRTHPPWLLHLRKRKNDKHFLSSMKQSAWFSERHKGKQTCDISFFSETLNSIQDGLPEGARYIFDSLTGMQDSGETKTAPTNSLRICVHGCTTSHRSLLDIGKRGPQSVLQGQPQAYNTVVIELYKKREKLYLKALKLEAGPAGGIQIPCVCNRWQQHSMIPAKKEPSFDIGIKIKDARTRLGMSQKTLQRKSDWPRVLYHSLKTPDKSVSPFFLSDSRSSWHKSASLLQSDRKTKDVSWLMTSDSVRKNLYEKEPGYSIFNIISAEKASAYLAVIDPDAELYKHFLSYKKEELIHVIKGSISVKVEGIEKELKAGDSIYLKDSLPSLWRNKSSKEVEVFVICMWPWLLTERPIISSQDFFCLQL